MRVVLAISLDGRIAKFKGDKTQLGKEGDRKVLEEALSWSDATLMGGETLRQHQSTCLIHNEKLINDRIRQKKTQQPTSIVISNQKGFANNFPFFSQPISRWLITSCESIDNKNIYDRIIPLKESWSEMLSNLSNIGISNLLILGGAKLIESLLLEDQINELQLTIVPKLLGGDIIWTPKRINNLPKVLSKSDSWVLKENILLGNNEIMLRYYRNK